MGKGGGGGGTTTVQKSDPWSGVQPYLIGGSTTDPTTGQVTGSTAGIFPEAQRLYQGQGFSPQMQSLADSQRSLVAGRAGQADGVFGLSNQVNQGAFDPAYQRVASIAGAPTVSGQQIAGADRVNSQSVDPMAAFRSMGGANPTGSINQMLSGQVNTSALDPVVNNAMRRMGENFNEQVMPGIGQAASAAGQYGGSRQGIAEGLAQKGLAYSMGDMASNMYNNAFNTAQSNMYGTANNMAGLGLSNAQGNANRDLTAQTTNSANQLASQQFNANMAQQENMFNASNAMNAQQFNANLGLSNNTQAAANAAQLLGNRQAAIGLTQTGNSMQDQNYQQQMGLLDAPNQYNWQNLNRYASIIQPGSGIGGSSTTTAPSNTNSGASLLGGAMAGAQLGGLLGVGSGWGALGGALLMSDRRTKTDIEAVGKLDNGLTVYRYRYKAGGPLMLGVMADEVNGVKPGAVVNVGGIDYVNYGEL